MLKKIFTWGFLVMTLCFFTACTSSHGTFYSLNDSYELGFITQDDLQRIADFHNNLQFPDSLSDDVAKSIKKSAAYEARHSLQNFVSNAKADDYSIIQYYGCYNGCYVVMLNEPYFDFPAVEVDSWEEVGNVKFHITSHYKIKLWKK